MPEGHGIAQLGQNPCAEIAITGSMECTLNPYHPFRDAAHQDAYIKLRQDLEKEVNKAGGTFIGMDFAEVTAFDLLSSLCGNNIVFKYISDEGNNGRT